ncbi:hypothetical protein GH714_013478 [Hevea brasiliensis]|uniref:Serine-threonine/tyrosine-protein kinase catalytic domain-containing protein n=1 Tax=Hevea brasiliensis TaxID=3981 RepID=A0A6A6N3H7_HEVBR|nr:hypothetical protein GH714_013478 [Hevea brasiliensis]
MAESLHIDVKQDDDNGSEKADRFAQKVSSLERIFLIANFILELPSAAFDQLSSAHKPHNIICFFVSAFDNPIKVSVWPVFFAFGLLSSRLSGNTAQRPTPHVRRLYRVEEFSLAQLAAATNDFSLQNKIGVGRSFVVYRGKLPDGREVAVKRGDIVLLELLTGKRAVFKDEDNGGAITSLVDFAVPKILANELVKVLDNRIDPPKLVKEAEAVELMACTALHCVNLEGNNRPSITNIVANLEQASSLCDVRNEGLPIGAEELHGRSNEEVANSNGTEKHHSEVLERQQ